MSIPTTITLSRALAELENHSEQSKETWVRVHRADGTRCEGQLVSVEPAQLVLIDSATESVVHVVPSELVALDVRKARRGREWMLAGAGIVGATVALVAYATLPWVRPGKGDITTAFMILYSTAGALLPVLLARTRLRQWLTEWRALYPPDV